MNDRAQEVLDFWFASVDSAEYGKSRAMWFRKSTNFDAEIRRRFLRDIESALTGSLDGWAQTPQGLLALIIVLDQFTRNVFRDTADAFAGDARALALARKAVASGWDTRLLPVQRWFVYLPFEHSENLADQEQSLRLFKALEVFPACNGVYKWAESHHEVIARFGRFPHRNAALGRESTAAEREYLAQPGAGF